MLETSILENLEKLPEALKQEVLHYTEFLVEKYGLEKLEAETPKKKREAGILKGKIWMSDDFDEPLEDFKDYM